MLIVNDEEKRLVDSYRQVNKQLRKQLENLNQQIDKIIAFKTNRIGLKKSPNVHKNLSDVNDIKVIQLEVDNLKKRLEQLHYDNAKYIEKSKINFMDKAKALEEALAARCKEKDEIKKKLYYYEKKLQTENTEDVIKKEIRMYDKIEQVNQQLIRCRKMQRELQKQIEYQHNEENKKNQLINQVVEQHNIVVKQTYNLVTSKIEPATHSQNNDQEWKQLKKDFLQLKQSKQREQTLLNKQNDDLRRQIKSMQKRIRDKRTKMQYIKSHEIKRKVRNYSTLDSSINKEESMRYKNRNNVYKYSTKN